LNDASTGFLSVLLIFLIATSALFSSSETAMMSLNRFKLKHLRKNNRSAERAAKLLERPDRLIGLILIGNNAVNILTTIVITILFQRWLGEDNAILATTVVLTFIMLVFAEVTPKTIAAVYPERIAFPVSRLLKLLMTFFGFLVVSLNWVTNSLVRLFGIDPTKLDEQHMSSEELRTVVDEAGNLIPDQNQGMLLGILDLEKVTVNDVMIPRNEIMGIDLTDPMEKTVKTIMNSNHTRLPVYEGDINNIVGTLHLRKINRALHSGSESLTIEAIKRFSRSPYFIPENTALSTQLMNFQKQRQRIGFIVDEYGDIEGLITIDDVLEEIVGSYTTSLDDAQEEQIKRISEHEYIIDGGVSLRDINKETKWQLPTEGAKTLNGIAMEHLEVLPDGIVSFRLSDAYQVEAIELGDKVIEKLRIKYIKPAEE